MHGLVWLFDMRNLLRSLDWGSYEARYKPGGRFPIRPVIMLGILLLGFATGRTSLRQMAEMARTDLRAWWLTGGIMPDYSTLCRFINRHSEDLTEATFERLTKKVCKILVSKADSLGIDGTVVQAAASRFGLLKQEAAAQAALEAREAAGAAPEGKSLAEKADLAEKVHETAAARDAARVADGKKAGAVVAPHEPEAVYQPLKQGGCAPSYKPSVAVNADRIITAHHVEASNEPNQVKVLLEQSARVAGAPETVMLDAGYNCASVFAVTEELGVEMLCPEGKTTGGPESYVQARKLFGKDKFSFDQENDRYSCPGGRTLEYESRCKPKNGDPAYRRYKSEDCSGCPFAEQCLGKGELRTIKRYEHEAKKEKLREKMAQPATKIRYRQRQATVEPVHGEQ